MSNIYFSGGLLEIAYPSDRCLPEAAAGQGVRFRPEADGRQVGVIRFRRSTSIVPPLAFYF